ncbi:MAG: hypothetical protein E6J21_09875 [Chloroflexota bacterium]|nr:MAG: hypothetical protein E6J21_09875 [Chloroflexota bacterium]
MHSNDDRSTASTAHEQLIQMLSAILLQLNTLQAMVRSETMLPMPLDLNTLYNGLNAIEQLAREAIHEIRASDDDQPLAELVGVTLAEALSRVIEETAESLGLSSRVAFSGEERTLSGYTERLLYRIAQEALYQVHMHGNVRKLRFTFSYGRDEVQMSIEDDGILSIAEEETPLPHFKANGMQASLKSSLTSSRGHVSWPVFPISYRLHMPNLLRLARQAPPPSPQQTKLPPTRKCVFLSWTARQSPALAYAIYLRAMQICR